MSPKNMSEDITSEDKASGEDERGYDIAKEEGRHASEQRKVQRMRKCNVRMLVLSVFILMGLCLLLIARVRTLDGTVARLTAQVESLLRLASQQREMMDQLAQESQSAMKNNAVVGSLEKETEDGTDTNGPGASVMEPEEEEPDAAHKVYLTFDDGPSANTEKILKILEKYDVKATFFVVGTACEDNEEMLGKIVEAGHTLGMHSGTHKYSELYASVENFGEDLKRQQEYLYEVTGVESKVYRFPGGSSNKVSDISMKEFARYLDSQDVRFFDWNVSSGDASSASISPASIIRNCTAKLQEYDESIILMHDAYEKSTTVEALPALIETIQAMEGTKIVPISDDTEAIHHISND